MAAAELLDAPPRKIPIGVVKPVRWIFADAAAKLFAEEKFEVTLGGVLIGVEGSILRHFSEKVPEFFIELWKDSRQPITYGESMAALVAKLLWHDRVPGCDLGLAVDNIGAQQSLVRWSTRSELLRGLLKAHLLVDAMHRLRCWVTWVPSESNVADKPSRLDCSEVVAAGSTRDVVPASLWVAVRTFMGMSDRAVAKAFGRLRG